MSARLRPQEAPQEGAAPAGGAGPVTHEPGERPAIADRRERAGGSAGRWRHRRGPYQRRRRSPRRDRATRWCLVGGKAPSKRAVDVSPLNRGALAPHTAAPSPWTGATSSPPGPCPPRITGRPPPLLPGPLPLAARNENTNAPAARGAPPPGPHWTASTPRGSNRCTINSTNDHANASAGNP